MVNFTTYSLIGVGIASAIGFVFALSFLGNNTTLTQQEEERSFLLTSQLKQTDDDQPVAADMQAGAPEASLMMMKQADDLHPLTLTSITALNSNQETISEVTSQMQFEINKPVLIQASLANPNEVEIPQHTITLGIRTEGGFDEQLLNFQGDIAGNENTTLELYWTPDTKGNYTVMLFSMTLSDLPSGEPAKPTAEIPVRVG